MYKRITNIAEKIKDARLKIDEWKVLFAVDNNSNPQKIADFLEISLEKVNDALAHLAEEGFVASGEEVEVVEDQAETEVAPMKMEPEKQAEELVEELFEEKAEEESVLEEIVADEESEAADIIEEIVEEPVEETILEDKAEEEKEEVILEDLVEEVAEEETIIEDEIDEAKEDVSLDEIIPAEEESIIEEEKDTEEGLVLDDFIDDKTEAAPEEVKEDVRGACEILGIDPLYVANEGKLVAVVPANIADDMLSAMQTNVLGKEAVIIGEVTDKHPGIVALKTGLGANRIVDMPVGEQLPRIC